MRRSCCLSPHQNVYCGILQRTMHRSFVGILMFLSICSGQNDYVVMDDMEMKRETYEYFFGEEAEQRASVSSTSLHKLWDNNKTDGKWMIPYAFEKGVIEIVRSKILDALKDFESHACLKFVEATTESESILFTSDSCSAGVGRSSSRQVNIAEGFCEKKGNIHHEIMHALGFFHEHQRPDRNQHVTIHYGHIKPGLGINFKRMKRTTIDSRQVEYDYKSVLHYSSTAGARRKGAMTITKLDGSEIQSQRDFMSEKDIKQLNLLYRCPGFVKCADTIRSTTCELHARRGYCFRKASQMYDLCRMTCGFCSCEDKPVCSRHVKTACYEPETRAEMISICPVMCGYCGKACFDANESTCAEKYSASKGCDLNEYHMAYSCPKTCGYCVGV